MSARGGTAHGKVAAASAALAVLLLGGSAARADEVDATEVNLNRARKLMESRATLNEACTWLEASYRSNQRGDVLLNLAECHRRQGKAATAWAEFDKAIRIGTQVKFPEAVAAATKLRDDLALHLSKVTVRVPPAMAALPGLTVQLDSAPLPPASWNTPAVHDPGAAEVTASAKGYKPFSARVDVGGDRDDKTIDVALEAEPPPPPPPPPPPVKAAPPSSSIWPWIVGGVGVGLAGAAIAFEVDSTAAGSKLDSSCGGAPRNACPHGFDFASLRSRELRGFDLFLGLGVTGVAAIGTGATVLVARRLGTNQNQTSLWLSPTSVSISSSF